MPHYDYKCDKCGYVFEAFQKINDERLTACPECGGAIKRLIGGGAGIIFKGSGFYKNDYKNSSPAPACEGKMESNPACSNCPKLEPGKA
ncbi:MAG: FmdB family zinc ribbon protein [Brevinematales bacterium]|jgi:putative FmdB family regulatory protein